MTTGQRQTLSRGFYTIAISEAMAVRRGDATMLRRVQIRECGDPSTAPPSEAQRIEMCFVSVEGEIHAVAATSSFDGEQTMNMFRDLLGALRSVNSPNTLILITEGFVLDDQHPSFTQISNLAAAARTSIYVHEARRADVRYFRGARAPSRRHASRIETGEIDRRRDARQLDARIAV